MGVATTSIGLVIVFALIGLVVFGLISGPILMLASKLVLRRSVTFGQAFAIAVASLVAGAAITWPVHAGIGDIAEGRMLAQIMGWAISFGVMTALVDKATSAGLTRSATVAAMNFVIYLAAWFLIALALMGTLMTLFSTFTGKAAGLISLL